MFNPNIIPNITPIIKNEYLKMKVINNIIKTNKPTISKMFKFFISKII